MTPSQKIYRAVSCFALIIFPLFLLFFARAYFTDQAVLRGYLKENRPVEWLTVIFLLLASIVAFAIVVRTRKEQGSIHWFFVAFAVLCLIGTMEEMSWEQRILGWKPPENLARIFAEDPAEAEIKLQVVVRRTTGIKARYIYTTASLPYGVLLPILYTWSAKIRSYLNGKKIVVPSISLSPGFVLTAAVAFTKLLVNQNEIAEMFFGLALFLMAVLEFIKLYLPDRTPAPQAGPNG